LAKHPRTHDEHDRNSSSVGNLERDSMDASQSLEELLISTLEDDDGMRNVVERRLAVRGTACA
jgi:hypothetical protein